MTTNNSNNYNKYIKLEAKALYFAEKLGLYDFYRNNSNLFLHLLHKTVNEMPYIGYNDDKVKRKKYYKKFIDDILNYKMDLFRSKFMENIGRDNEDDYEYPNKGTMGYNDYNGYDMSNMDYARRYMDNNLDESKVKNVLITNEQAQYIKEHINEGKKITVKSNHPIDPNKVKHIVKYMDKTFKKGHMHGIGEDGFPMALPIVGLIGTDGNILRNMTDIQMFYLLQDRFKNLFDDCSRRDNMLKQIIKDWYKGKITKDGLLTVNMI